MKYPKFLRKGDTIGVCAPSGGVPGEALSRQLDHAISHVTALGYRVVETASVRGGVKCVSADSATRAAEFMSLYENPEVAAILPPWGGEFLMDILPHLDFERLAALPAKWVCGYSDTTTLLLPLTLLGDIATVHGSNLMNMGSARIHETDLRAFEVMTYAETMQKSWDTYGGFSSWENIPDNNYALDQPSAWKSLQDETHVSFQGRMIGGCLDVLRVLLGTRFAPVGAFLETYKQDGLIWAVESCEMSAADLYRALWQMRESGWFRHCAGMIVGRPDGFSDQQDFNLTDALRQGLGDLNIPVIYDADIGHIPPQMQIVNGAIGKVDFADGKATVRQSCRP